MEEEIPIDIHVTKLLDWLTSRRHCKSSWQSQIAEIREKINTALEDMPEHKAIAELLAGSYINYFHCCQIIEILKETEADTKNLFGMYGSKRMKDWQDIVRLYQKDNAYLAEAANLLLRNVKYEIPNIKKQINKYKQLQQECDKKVADYTKSVASAQREFQTTKKQLGITGDKVKMELLKRTLHLSEVYDNVVSNVKALEKSVHYYSTFSQFVAGVRYTLPLISYVIEKGNTTTYEWLYGEAPQRIEAEDIAKVIETAEKENEAEEIDWDISISEEPEIDYGITMDESGIEVESPNTADSSVARGNEALTVLDNPRTKNEFIAQLMELQSFLRMRLLETQKESDTLFVMNDVAQESSENIVKMLDACQIVKQLMTDPVTERLHFIKHSNKYVDKITSLFEQKTSAIEKMIASQETLKVRKQELIVMENETKPVLASLTEKTRKLQEQVESDISKKYKNRPVHLMGGL